MTSCSPGSNPGSRGESVPFDSTIRLRFMVLSLETLDVPWSSRGMSLHPVLAGLCELLEGFRTKLSSGGWRAGLRLKQET